MEECKGDCCEVRLAACQGAWELICYAALPRTQEHKEHQLQDEEDKSYVRGRITYVTPYLLHCVSLTTLAHRFIEEDPGRQSISGSLNPIDEGEWSDSAYIQATAQFFSSISKNDTVTTTQMIQDGEDVNRRDHVGRTPLHVAILSNSVECANALIDAGARMTARLVGGRTSLHLAAQMGLTSVGRKMLALAHIMRRSQRRKSAKRKELHQRKIRRVPSAYG